MGVVLVVSCHHSLDRSLSCCEFHVHCNDHIVIPCSTKLTAASRYLASLKSGNMCSEGKQVGTTQMFQYIQPSGYNLSNQRHGACHQVSTDVAAATQLGLHLCLPQKKCLPQNSSTQQHRRESPQTTHTNSPHGADAQIVFIVSTPLASARVPVKMCQAALQHRTAPPRGAVQHRHRA